MYQAPSYLLLQVQSWPVKFRKITRDRRYGPRSPVDRTPAFQYTTAGLRVIFRNFIGPNCTKLTLPHETSRFMSAVRAVYLLAPRALRTHLYFCSSVLCCRPRGPLRWLDPGAFGTLGVGAGFALGVKLCNPETEVWVIFGDGALGYSMIEFDTFVRHNVSTCGLLACLGMLCTSLRLLIL